MSIFQDFTIACRDGDVETVRNLVNNGVDPSYFNNKGIRVASEKGHACVVRLLLEDPRVDPSCNDNSSILWASREGHVEVVRLLLQDPRVDPTVCDNLAIQIAGIYGHTDVAQLLTEHMYRLDGPEYNKNIL